MIIGRRIIGLSNRREWVSDTTRQRDNEIKRQRENAYIPEDIHTYASHVLVKPLDARDAPAMDEVGRLPLMECVPWIGPAAAAVVVAVAVVATAAVAAAVAGIAEVAEARIAVVEREAVPAAVVVAAMMAALAAALLVAVVAVVAVVVVVVDGAQGVAGFGAERVSGSAEQTWYAPGS